MYRKIIGGLAVLGFALTLLVAPSVVSPETAPQAKASGAVHNSCAAGLRNSLKGLQSNGVVVWIGCGQTKVVQWVIADAPTRLRNTSQSGSVCWRGGAWARIDWSYVGWTVKSC